MTRTTSPPAEAIGIARALAVQTPREWVPLAALPGRMLCEPVRARLPQPHAMTAAMDGWALATASAPGVLAVVGESAAGHPYDRALEPGEAVRISTGAVLPRGADVVVRREATDECDGSIVVGELMSGRDVRAAGEDFPKSAEVLPAGLRVRSHDLAVVASCGWDGAFCRRRPRVAVIACGDELVAPGTLPAPHEVVDGNRFAIAAAVAAAGGEIVRSELVGDTADSVTAALMDALVQDGAAADLVITIGGASVGPHDHVRSALAAQGVALDIDGIAMRPGRPTGVASLGDATILVLPGTPGGALVGFWVIGRELLGDPAWTAGVLTEGYAHPRSVDTFVRCRRDAAGFTAGPHQGSLSVAALATADGMAWLPPGEAAIPAGAVVAVCPLS